MNYLIDMYTSEVRKNTKCKGYSIHDYELVKDKKYVKNHMQKYNNWPQCHEFYFGTCKPFKIEHAIMVYEKYKPKSIFDPCAGWGGRGIGASMLSIPYHCIDCNHELVEPYARICKDWGITFEFGDCLKIQWPEAEMIFTSPPYFNKEIYIGSEFKSKKEWRTWYIEFAKKCTHKIVCLNVNVEIYEIIKEVLGDCSEKIQLPIHKRGKYVEFIYVWLKA
jgi:hypothetical protein